MDGKIFHLQLARVGVWILSVILTALFVITATGTDKWYAWVAIVVSSVVGQYIFTRLESALFSGDVPPPWHEDAKTPTNVVWFVACVILLTDMMLQMGGVGTFIGYVDKSMSGDILANDFGISESGIRIIKVLLITVLSFLSAVGSEVVGLYIAHLESKGDDVGDVNIQEILEKERNQRRPFVEQEKQKPTNPRLIINSRKGK